MIPTDYFLRALADRRLSRRDLLVLGALAELCDPPRWDRAPYREAKLLLVAERAGVRDRANVARSIKRLRTLGYLERGPAAGSPGRQPATYRLTDPPPLSPMTTLPAA